jgi:type II secretory pathway pseudopilin PulG
MHRFRSWRIGSEAGYTLIELLAVTAILMIISLFAVPLYNTLTDKARLATSLEDLRVIEQALEAYRADHGHYPNKLGLLSTEGYLRKDYSYKSPWSTKNKPRYYFYAIDDSFEPHAYLLGDPGPQKKCAQSDSESGKIAILYESNKELLPCGNNPHNLTARMFAGENKNVNLSPEPKTPLTSLSGFRKACNPLEQQSLLLAPACTVKTES